MLSFNIGYKFLTSSTFQMILISLGIAIGVSVQIFIGSLIMGLQQTLIDSTVGSSPHITITAERNSRIEEYQDLKQELKDNDDLKYVSIVYDNNGFIISNDITYPVLVRGFNIEDANSIYKFEERIEGILPKEDEVVIGILLAKELEVDVGDTIKIETPNSLKTEVLISGIIDFKVEALNKSWIISQLPTAHNVFNEEDVITAIEIQIEDVFIADEIADTIETDLIVSNWKDANEQLLSGLSGQSVSSLIIQVFVMISVMLAIASVLIISVVQKRRQLGILKAMGITDQDATKIFLFQGLLLGAIGSTLGVLFGLGLAYMFAVFVVTPEGTPVVDLLINYRFILISWIIAISVATIASIIPAISSKKLTPMEVIRNG